MAYFDDAGVLPVSFRSQDKKKREKENAPIENGDNATAKGDVE